ncbi:hypothetical protein [Hirschia maritima]|uniref:hypothetical protein n=1 Tax=Hirschia maritima TaxID=1121961 RepID=UPI00035FDE68|nr:hypothetical protein [Hirschia maritima]
MGCLGSGRRYRAAAQSDEFHKLDLASFKSEWFERNWSGTVTWSKAGCTTGSIGYRLSPKFLCLSYSSGGEAVNETFAFEMTKQHFGGKRRWIICRGCERRCRVLYGAKLFRCRKCYELTYPSQYEDIRVPGLSTATSLKDKLGGESGFAYPFPNKPKGMHWNTYRRWERMYEEAEDRTYWALIQRFV